MPMHDWKRVRPNTYHDFHAEWLIAIKHALNRGILPGDHYAMVEQVAMEIQGDVLALDPPGADPLADDTPGLALTAPTAAVVETARPAVPQLRRRLAVHAGDDRVVAVIELVSRANKRSREGSEAFVGKATELLLSGVHLLVVDPFPPTRRDPAGLHPVIWGRVARRRKDAPKYAPPPGQPLAVASYASGPRMFAAVEPFAVGEPVPDGPLFLTPKGHVTVPLESTYQAAFAEVPARWRDVLTAPPGSP